MAPIEREGEGEEEGGGYNLYEIQRWGMIHKPLPLQNSGINDNLSLIEYPFDDHLKRGKIM